MVSESFEQTVHREPETRPKRKLNVGVVALIIMALSTTGGGAVLLVLLNGLGLVILLAGLVTMLIIAGGGDVRMGPGRGKASGIGAMRKREMDEMEEERRKRTGEED